MLHLPSYGSRAEMLAFSVLVFAAGVPWEPVFGGGEGGSKGEGRAEGVARGRRGQKG